ncbi:MAG: hypothetical protein LZF86_110830 [Nitrospira sp.]|nr:MAG: hypothetical protein LZF86_110830 [Nitrospira sp.]
MNLSSVALVGNRERPSVDRVLTNFYNVLSWLEGVLCRCWLPPVCYAVAYSSACRVLPRA